MWQEQVIVMFSFDENDVNGALNTGKNKTIYIWRWHQQDLDNTFLRTLFRELNNILPWAHSEDMHQDSSLVLVVL